MRHHRAYMDNPKLFRTVAHRPPIARGHRSFLAIAGATRRAKTPKAVECDSIAERREAHRPKGNSMTTIEVEG